MKRGSKPVKVDPTILAELLTRDGIREQVARMTPEALAWYKELLVSQGIYAAYVKERRSKR
jgi:hypothetical protein